MEQVLVELIRNTDGWVLVVIFALFVAGQVWKHYYDGKNITLAITTLKNTVEQLLRDIRSDITVISQKIDKL